jgi:hypothetical protein
MKFTQVAVALWVAVAVVGGASAVAEAHHSWNGYHWNITSRDSVKYPLRVGDNVVSTWDSILSLVSADWNKSAIKNKVVTGASNSNCDPVSGRTEVCNGMYGETGWLGLTQLWISGDGLNHITQATVRVNDTYLTQAPFNTNAWKIQTLCHEIGHIYGLDHQDNTFENANLGSCLDLTNDPDGSNAGQLSNLQPNQHDYDVIKSVYNHKHTTTKPRIGTSSDTSALASSSLLEADWGTAEGGHTHKGKNARFVKDLPDGAKVVTFVHWVE